MHTWLRTCVDGVHCRTHALCSAAATSGRTGSSDAESGPAGCNVTRLTSSCAGAAPTCRYVKLQPNQSNAKRPRTIVHHCTSSSEHMLQGSDKLSSPRQAWCPPGSRAGSAHKPCWCDARNREPGRLYKVWHCPADNHSAFLSAEPRGKHLYRTAIPATADQSTLESLLQPRHNKFEHRDDIIIFGLSQVCSSDLKAARYLFQAGPDSDIRVSPERATPSQSLAR